jgi:hypothetical protein
MLAHNGERPATDDAVNGARKSGNGTDETSKPHTHKSQASIRVDRYTLHYGSARPSGPLGVALDMLEKGREP